MRISRGMYKIKQFLFPITSGMGVVVMDEVLAGCSNLDIQLTQWDQDRGAGTFWDMVSIATLVRALQPKYCFEIGTGMGRGTTQMAANAPDDAVIYTLDIDTIDAVGRIFRHHPLRQKIRTIVDDSTKMSFEEYEGRMDFVLVDGSHEYEYVMYDTETAFRLIRPGGIIIWHDADPSWPGVVRALKEQARKRDIRRLHGTSYAIHGTIAGARKAAAGSQVETPAEAT